MRRSVLAAAVLAAACSKSEPPEMVDANLAPPPGSRAWKIESARGAAPYEVSSGARVLDWPAADTAQPAELRPGGNGWTCFPDDPNTPAEDPMCADEEGMKWIEAYLAGRRPELAGMAVFYMLRGGSSASDTDPFKTAPDSGQEWLTDPPHLMIAMPNPRTAFRGLPTARAATGPWVMFAGTPYAHLMVPAAATTPSR